MEPIKIDQPNKLFKGILNGLAITAIIGAIIYFTPRIVMALSDDIIRWTNGSEVWIAFFTGIAIGLTLGIIFTCTWLDIRCKYCGPVDDDADTERQLGRKILAAMDKEEL